MRIILKNEELNAAIRFLTNMKIEGTRKNRQRSKLKNALLDAAKELHESQMELFEKFGQKDASGKLVINEPQTGYELKKETRQEYVKEMNTLLAEEVVIDCGVNAKIIAAFGETLAEYDGVLSGEDAEICDRLMDEFEKEENQDVKD